VHTNFAYAAFSTEPQPVKYLNPIKNNILLVPLSVWPMERKLNSSFAKWIKEKDAGKTDKILFQLPNYRV